MTFGEIALGLSAHAAQWLGWRPDEFWRATPDELLALLQEPDAARHAAIDRTTLQRLMEQDHG